MAESPTAEPRTSKQPLDDLMLAMDVVDTLRHRASLVERELNQEERDQALIERLRQIYAAQGIDVPDHVLAAGVAALKEGRFTYAPPEPGLSVTLAKIYVSRDRWITPLLILCGLAVAAWLGYYLLVTAPHQRLLRELPASVSRQQQAIAGMAHAAEAKQQAEQLASRAQRALSEDDLPAARTALGELEELRGRLEQQYELLIVVEGSTGVWRVPSENEQARNYYIIVQAFDPDGQLLTLPITSEEDGRTRRVTKWGVRVDEETFHQIAADKKDDGIIQRNRFGVKSVGDLEPRYLIPTAGGAITSW